MAERFRPLYTLMRSAASKPAPAFPVDRHQSILEVPSPHLCSPHPACTTPALSWPLFPLAERICLLFLGQHGHRRSGQRTLLALDTRLHA